MRQNITLYIDTIYGPKSSTWRGAGCGAGAVRSAGGPRTSAGGLVAAAAARQPTVCACAGGDVTDVGKKRMTKKNRRRPRRKTRHRAVGWGWGDDRWRRCPCSPIGRSLGDRGPGGVATRCRGRGALTAPRSDAVQCASAPRLATAPRVRHATVPPPTTPPRVRRADARTHALAGAHVVIHIAFDGRPHLLPRPTTDPCTSIRVLWVCALGARVCACVSVDRDRDRAGGAPHSRSVGLTTAAVRRDQPCPNVRFTTTYANTS